MHILVDSGSTHSFISNDLVKKLNLTAQVVSPQLVSVADGTTHCAKMCLMKYRATSFTLI